MRIVEDKDGERFLVIESDEDFEKFKEDLLNIAREKAKDRARKPSYETRSPKWKTQFLYLCRNISLALSLILANLSSTFFLGLTTA